MFKSLTPPTNSIAMHASERENERGVLFFSYTCIINSLVYNCRYKIFRQDASFVQFNWFLCCFTNSRNVYAKRLLYLISLLYSIFGIFLIARKWWAQRKFFYENNGANTIDKHFITQAVSKVSHKSDFKWLLLPFINIMNFQFKLTNFQWTTSSKNKNHRRCAGQCVRKTFNLLNWGNNHTKNHLMPKQSM